MEKLVKVALLGAVAMPSLVMAASVADARSMGMAGTGVANATYLSSSFHNPALATNFKEDDDFGIILPTFGGRVHDANSLHTKVSDFEQLTTDFENNPSDKGIKDKWVSALEDMEGSTVDSDIMVGGAIAFPNKYLATNAFVQGRITMLCATNIDSNDLSYDPSQLNVKLNSSAQLVAAGTVDIGLTLAREIDLAGRKLQVGISPKYQTLVAVNYKNKLDNFSNDFDLEEDLQTVSAYNMDAGIAYNMFDNVTFGLTARNMISNELETNQSGGDSVTYLVEPEYTMGLAYANNFVSLAVDVDLNERKLFKEFDYAEQFTRIGAEFDAWGWSQVRVGYTVSMTDFQEDLITAGLGFKPFGLFGLDMAGQYGEDDNYGVSAQVVMNF
jgi:hypothetical protein